MSNEKLIRLLQSKWFENSIFSIIILNAIVLGLYTINDIPSNIHFLLLAIDKLCILIFVVEILLKLVAYNKLFFKSHWRSFDLLIVIISIIPASNYFSVFRALRIIRALRLISAVKSMKRVVNALLISLPGLFSTAALLALFFYIGSVITTSLFAADFPQWFGNIGRSLYSLFQIMTLESWSMGIVRPVMKLYPYAWLFFIPFILVTTFILLNFLIAIIVDAIAHLKEQQNEESDADASSTPTELQQVLAKLDALEKKLAEK